MAGQPVVPSHPAVTAMVESLGIDPDKVRKFVLTFEPGQIATVEVTAPVDEAIVAGMAEFVRRFELREKPPMQTFRPGEVTHHLDGRVEVESIETTDDPLWPDGP